MNKSGMSKPETAASAAGSAMKSSGMGRSMSNTPSMSGTTSMGNPTTEEFQLALFHPATQGALTGVTTGYVDRDWARAHHAKWVEAEERAEAARDSGAAEQPLEPALPATLGEQLPER